MSDYRPEYDDCGGWVFLACNYIDRATVAAMNAMAWDATWE